MSEFSLERNAFAILDVGLRSNHDHIVEAHDDRLFDGGDESSLGLARSRLTVVRDRIDEEVSFLPELAPNRAREVLSGLKSVASPDQAVALIEQVPNLSRLNVIADLLGRLHDKEQLVGRFVEAQAKFDPDAAREALEQARAGSGIGQITDTAWRLALVKLRERHATVLSDTIVRLPRGPAMLAEVLEGVQGQTLSGWYRAFIDEIVNRYDRWSQPKLGAIDEKLDEAIATMRQHPGSAAGLASVKDRLREWDQLSQPVQLRDQAKGLDEPRSKRVFEKVRDLAIDLANDHGELDAALDLSRALQETFPELPSVVDLIEKDIEALGDLVKEARLNRILGPLAAVAQQAENCLPALGSDIANGHFHDNGEGLAASLFREFQAARANADQLTDPILPWRLVRSIAIDLNNDADNPEAATIIVAHILESAPEGIRQRLRDDLATLNSRVQQRKLTDALENNQLGEAHRLATELLATASADDRESLRKVRTAIAQRQAKRIINWVWWGGIGLVALIAVIVESGTKSTEYPSTDYSSDSSDYGSPPAVSPTPTTGTSSTADNSAAGSDQSGEEAPPSDYYGTLSVRQLRYCLFEDVRMGVLNRETPPSAYAQFNARVDDFNSRCRGARYDSGDRARVEQELATNRSTLDAEAREILGGWLSAAPAPITQPAYTPPELPTPTLGDTPVPDQSFDVGGQDYSTNDGTSE